MLQSVTDKTHGPTCITRSTPWSIQLQPIFSITPSKWTDLKTFWCMDSWKNTTTEGYTFAYLTCKCRHCTVKNSQKSFSTIAATGQFLTAWNYTFISFTDEKLIQKLLLVTYSIAADVFVFQQDNAPKHRAHDRFELLCHETQHDLWSANITDINPVHYHILWCCLSVVIYTT